MDFSYNYKHTQEMQQKLAESRSDGHPVRRLNLTGERLGFLAGTVFLGLLLMGSWSVDNLFMEELLAITGIWLLINLIKLQSATHISQNEKR